MGTMVRDTQKEKKVYKSVVHGKLNLKSGKFKKSKKKKLNKKKKKKIRDIDANKKHNHNQKNNEENNDENEEKKENNNNEIQKNNEYRAFKSDFEKAMEELTESEKRFLQRQKVNESHYITKQSKMTHRQRIEKYNIDLSNLSEHNDVPKVGPG